MKKAKLFLIVALTTIVSEYSQAQEILFSDNFSGNALNTNKWTATTYGGGSVSQGGGVLTFNHPNFQDGAFITSTSGFVSPYTVTGSFLADPDYAINLVFLRTTGDYDATHYNDPYGLSIGFYFGTDVSIDCGSPISNWAQLLGVHVTYNAQAWNYFSITDYGDSLSVVLNGALVIDKFAVDPALGVGTKISLGDSDNGNYSGMINSSSFGPVAVSAPEPSTYVLFGLSSTVFILVYRRRSKFRQSSGGCL